MRKIVVSFVVLALVIGTFIVLGLHAISASATPVIATKTPRPHDGLLVLDHRAGSTAAVITASWQHLTPSTTVRVTDHTADVGILCLGQSSFKGNGSCSWSIESSEADILGDHTIEATDGVIAAIAHLTITQSVDGLGTAGLIVLAVVLASMTSYRLRGGLLRG